MLTCLFAAPWGFLLILSQGRDKVANVHLPTHALCWTVPGAGVEGQSLGSVLEQSKVDIHLQNQIDYIQHGCFDTPTMSMKRD